MKKPLFLLLALLLLPASLAGCMQPSNPVVVENRQSPYKGEANYYQIYGPDGTGGLAPKAIALQARSLDAVFYEIAHALLGNTRVHGYAPLLKGQVTLYKLQLREDILTLNLSQNFYDQTLENQMLAVMGFVNTFTHFKLVSYVQFLVESRPLFFRQYPQYIPGVYSACPATVDAFKQLAGSATADNMHFQAMLFYNSADTTSIVPQVRMLQTTRQNFLSDVLAQLLPAAPQSGTMRITPRESPVYNTGENRLTLNLNIENATVDRNSEWPLVSMLVTSYFYCLPQLEWVNISVYGNENIPQYSIICRPGDYTNRIASRMKIFLPNQNGDGLYAYTDYFTGDTEENRIAQSIITLLSSRFAGMSPIADVSGLDGINLQSAVQNVWISGNVVYLNFSSQLFSAFSKLSPAQEKLLAYALINTASQTANADFIQFLCEGETRTYLGNTIVIANPLLRNNRLNNG